ncbi:hypothetical protein DFH11DRAFT_1731517 [Phellopilus nigrolimitatus]|nr:hypothetical protein DFH11DRAFT_1733114 [Phellopilus nigrolimitatus]KAH8108951.1 hypothetical protein DFH11DRAFT_1731517 [Phellopilus nigrolimitatus]
MPETIKKLEAYLKERYLYADWKPAFDAVFQAESDVPAAVSAIHELAHKAQQSAPPAIPDPVPLIPDKATIPQLESFEKSLMEAVDDLKKLNHIRGTAPTLEELVNPIEEMEIGESPYHFPGGDIEIIAEARRLVAEQNGDVTATEVLDDDPEDDNADEVVSAREGIELCEKLEKLCIAHSEADGVAALELQRQLRHMRGHLRRLDLESHKQVTLDSFFTVRDFDTMDTS